jgi:uncharacterized phage-associated protein
MAEALDVARYMLTLVNEEEGDLMSNLKLQKLLYYAQGYYLAICGEPLFEDEIFAWQYGPVVPSVYHMYKHYGRQAIPAPEEFDSNVLSERERQIVADVYEEYGQYEASVLMHFTHEEPPWQSTMQSAAISHKKLADYFKTQWA